MAFAGMRSEPNPIEDWRKRRSTAKAGHKKLAGRLKRLKARALNELSEDLHTQAFARIDCLDCANCCKSIPPVINDTDARRIAKHLGLNAGQFYVEYVVFDEDGDAVINASPCPFLGGDNLCSIYDVRPKACRQFPHTDAGQFAGLIDWQVENAQYCPAVFWILERMGEGL